VVPRARYSESDHHAGPQEVAVAALKSVVAARKLERYELSVHGLRCFW
jgi:hypothetical protein